MVTRTRCWVWTGCKNTDGYGRTMRNGKNIGVHRLMFILQFGEIPKGKLVMHTCDNPPCINPAHLKLGTHDENMQDMTDKGRRARFPGELNPSVKLTHQEVDKIRALVSEGLYAKDIAPLFGVSMATIYHIKNGRIWNRGYDEEVKFIEGLE